MNAGIAIGLVLILLLVIGLALGVIGAWNNYQTNLQYQRDVGKYFEFADRASDAPTKLAYYNQYIDALKREHLDSGASSVFFKEQPNALLEDNFKVALSLQKRLVDLNGTDPKSQAYQLGIQEISHEEFCWFPEDAFIQGYELKHGAWGNALFPIGTSNRCTDSTSSSSH